MARWHEEVSDVPRKSPCDIVLSSAEARELQRRASKYTLPYFQVVRAQLILLANRGLSNGCVTIFL